jgi:signal recognition particle subunit SEC65
MRNRKLHKTIEHLSHKELKEIAMKLGINIVNVETDKELLKRIFRKKY